MDLLFLNVYAVTRHYGGPEDGGWYFNRGEPLASVPIRAVRVQGHSHCFQCNRAREGATHPETGQPYTFCRDLPEDYDARVEDEAQNLFHDQSYGDRGLWSDLPEEEQEKYLTLAAEQIQARAPEAFHLQPQDQAALERQKQDLEAMFADEAHGNIYSVLGGVAIEVRIEERFARAWPEERPHYE